MPRNVSSASVTAMTS